MTKVQTEKPTPKDVQFFADAEAFDNNCANKRFCLIGFLDGRMNEKSMKAFDHSFEVLEKLLADEKLNQYEIGWVNATCHVNLRI
jgi:hypothetical protein